VFEGRIDIKEKKKVARRRFISQSVSSMTLFLDVYRKKMAMKMSMSANRHEQCNIVKCRWMYPLLF